MDEQRRRTGFDSQLFLTKLYSPRWPHTPAQYTLEMRVDVERLKMEILLSQPATPSQCDSSPRRLPTVDTASDEPGTPRRLLAICKGSDKPGVSRAKSRSTKREEFFPLQVSVDGILHVSCTSPEQECILLQPDVGVDDNDEATTSKAQATTRKEFARLSIGRQQREMASTEQSKQFDLGG